MRFIEVNGIQYEVYPRLNYLLKFLVDPLRNFLLPASFLRRLVRKSCSPLVAESFRRPGGWRSMQIVYENADPLDLFDKMAVRYNPISMATRNRRKFVIARLTELLKSYAHLDHIEVVGIGAGPGLHVQDAICSAGIDPEQITAYMIDLDGDAAAFGKEQARRRGLERSIRFVQGDVRDIQSVLPDVAPQIVKIVGLLEYLNDTQTTELLTAMRSVMAPGGTLLTHGLVDRYNTSPFLERTFGLRHFQRTGEDVEQLLRRAGFQQFERHEIPMKIFPIRIAA